MYITILKSLTKLPEKIINKKSINIGIHYNESGKITLEGNLSNEGYDDISVNETGDYQLCQTDRISTIAAMGYTYTAQKNGNAKSGCVCKILHTQRITYEWN